MAIIMIASNENGKPAVVTTAETIMASQRLPPFLEKALEALGNALAECTGVPPRSLKLIVEWAGESGDSQTIDLSGYVNPNLN